MKEITITCDCGKVCRSKEEVEIELDKGHTFNLSTLHNFLSEVYKGNVLKRCKERVSFT